MILREKNEHGLEEEEEGEVLLQGGEAGVDPFTEHGDEHEIGISPQCISDEDEELDGSKGGDQDDHVKESETVEQSQAIGELIQSDDSAERDAIVDTENADPMGEENSESDGDETGSRDGETGEEGTSKEDARSSDSSATVDTQSKKKQGKRRKRNRKGRKY